VRAPRALNDLFLPPKNLAILNRQSFRPGVEVARTYKGGDGSLVSAFLHYEAGSSIPWDWHPACEHIFVLERSQYDENGTYSSGTVLINPPGSSHIVRSGGGSVVFTIWEKPVGFSRSSYEAYRRKREEKKVLPININSEKNA
tara:strand:- start:67 stop:495 length:429 start_codon:yes stop_codon:yes gene_type:complete